MYYCLKRTKLDEKHRVLLRKTGGGVNIEKKETGLCTTLVHCKSKDNVVKTCAQ